MATYARVLTDLSGNVILPYTRSKYVFMANDKTLESTITTINTNISTANTNITNLTNSLNNDTAGSLRNLINSKVNRSGDTMGGVLTAYGTAVANTCVRNTLVQDANGNTVASSYFIFRRK